MTTSRQAEFFSEILEWKRIPEDALVYFQDRLRRRVYSVLLDAFTRRAKERGLTGKELAHRIRRSGATVSRWLSRPSNLSLDSISLLMVGLGMDFDEFPFTPIEKTIVTAEQERQRAEALATFEKLHDKIFQDVRIKLSKVIAALAEEQNHSSVTSTSTLAPPPAEGAGMPKSPMESLQRPASSDATDYAAQAQRRTDQAARTRQRQLSKRIPSSGEAA